MMDESNELKGIDRSPKTWWDKMPLVESVEVPIKIKELLTEIVEDARDKGEGV